MKKYMYKIAVKSQYGVRSILRCADKERLEQEAKRLVEAGFMRLTDIYKSKSDYCTDGNTAIHVTVIGY